MKQLKKRLNPVAQKFGLYSAYELDKSEFVGGVTSLPLRYATIKDYLTQKGYEKPPKFMGVSLSATKLHPETHQPHKSTYRKIDPNNPRWQWHIHLWNREMVVEVFSHYEMRPDFKKIDGEDKSEMIGRLKIHYRPEYGTDYYQGKMDDVVAELLND